MLGREVRLEMERTRNQERWIGLSYQVTCFYEQKLLLENCAHEAEAVNSQVLPCNTVPFQDCFTVAESEVVRLEMERTRSHERRQWWTVAESEEVRIEMERTRRRTVAGKRG